MSGSEYVPPSGSPLRAMRESLDRNPPTPQEAALLLDAMRWHEDMVVTNDFDERVWLKPLIVDGKRIGITDCCFESDPCPRHREMANTNLSDTGHAAGTVYAQNSGSGKVQP